MKIKLTSILLAFVVALLIALPGDSAFHTYDGHVVSADIEMLACAIYQEAGSDELSDELRMMVGDVILNRMMDDRFPFDMKDVLMQYGQYGSFYWTGIRWPDSAYAEEEREAVVRAYQIAERMMYGEHSDLFGAGYIWQAEFPQGRDVIYREGIYFGK